MCSYLVLLYSYISRHVDAYSYHVLLFRRQRCGQISSVQWRGDLQPRQPTWYDITMVLRIRMHSLRRKPTGTYIYRCTRRITHRGSSFLVYTRLHRSRTRTAEELLIFRAFAALVAAGLLGQLVTVVRGRLLRQTDQREGKFGPKSQEEWIDSSSVDFSFFAMIPGTRYLV